MKSIKIVLILVLISCSNVYRQDSSKNTITTTHKKKKKKKSDVNNQTQNYVRIDNKSDTEKISRYLDTIKEKNNKLNKCFSDNEKLSKQVEDLKLQIAEETKKISFFFTFFLISVVINVTMIMIYIFIIRRKLYNPIMQGTDEVKINSPKEIHKKGSEQFIGELKFNIEKVNGKGEDSDPISILNPTEGVLGVFDGMGGAGATQYQIRSSSVSGAYLASRFTKKIVQNYFKNVFKNDRHAIVVNDIKEEIINSLRSKSILFNIQPSKLKSKLLKTLPTTAAILYYENLGGNKVRLSVFWAGDSRCYSLSPTTGLQQLTKDDLTEYGDALQNSRSDSPISNCINIDVDFTLRSHCVDIDMPLVFFAATDGVFGYFKTPMQFEFTLIDSLLAANDINCWSEILISKMNGIANDDFSISLVTIGFDSFEKLKSAFAERHKFIYENFELPISSINELNSKDNSKENDVENDVDPIDKLWETYKNNYELLIPKN